MTARVEDGFGRFEMGRVLPIVLSFCCKYPAILHYNYTQSYGLFDLVLLLFCEVLDDIIVAGAVRAGVLRGGVPSDRFGCCNNEVNTFRENQCKRQARLLPQEKDIPKLFKVIVE